MLKRRRDRNDVEISSDDAKWRKLRTFKLVDGEVEGETRADRLNAGLKKSLLDAMRSTKKQLAKEKEEKMNAGSKQVMSNFFMKLGPATDEGETTSSQRSSLEKITTPDRKKKKKPLTPRDNTDRHSSSRSFDKIVSKKSHGGEKVSRLSRPENGITRPERKFTYDKQESRKRKRNDLTLRNHTQIKTAPRKNQESICKFFGTEQKQRRPKKRNSILGQFIERIDEIEEKKSTADINEYLALDAKQLQVIETAKAKMETGRGNYDARVASHNGSDRSDKPGKKTWAQYRAKSRETSGASGALHSWLTPLDKRKSELEEISSGTPTKAQRPKHLAADRRKSPEMDRSNLDFMMANTSNEASYPAKKAKHSKHRDDSSSKQGGQLLKKQDSLGTVSARTPKQSLTGQWNHRKAPR